jgi:hypothetical protein
MLGVDDLELSLEILFQYGVIVLDDVRADGMEDVIELEEL